MLTYMLASIQITKWSTVDCVFYIVQQKNEQCHCIVLLKSPNIVSVEIGSCFKSIPKSILAVIGMGGNGWLSLLACASF